MDYSTLAFQLMVNMQIIHKAGPQKDIGEALRGETFVLHYIAYHNKEVLPSEISTQMNVSSARVAQTLNSIEKKGWITRQIDPNDRRRILVRLTQEGKRVAQEQHQIMLDKTSKMLNLIGEYDAKEYIRITSKLADILTNYEELE